MLNLTESPAALLSRLVAIPSVNPVYGGGGESGVSAFVRAWLKERGLACEIQEVAPGRENVIARLGEQGCPAVALEAHMDTVGVGGWARGDPFSLVEEAGRLYGRGSCDTKASLACFMLVLEYFSRHPQRLARPIAFLAAVDEESEQLGAFALAKEAARLGLGFAIAGEPTRCRLVARHKGVCRYRALFDGRAAHGSRPEDGDNAIIKASRFCLAVEKAGARLRTAGAEEMRRGTFNVGAIAGGIGFNVVPDRCEVDLDRRLGVQETPEAALQELQAMAAEAGGRIETVLARPPLQGRGSTALVDSLLQAASRAGHESSVIDAPYMTDAVAFEAAGVPSIVFGPGDIAQAHKVDEYIEVGEMERCIEILVSFLSR